jgi:Fe-Mn family superoxide dismutase
MAKFELPQLPYGLDALAPQISRETMEYHYGKHHKAYVDKLNELLPGSKFEGMSLEEIVKKADGAIFNQAAQVWNHTFFFMALSPDGKTKPGGGLAVAIDAAFGSFDKFMEEFTKAAVGRFGSGWAWLVADGGGKLSIETSANAQNPLSEGKKAILTVDVWEHAYYIDYRNARAEGVKAALAKTDWAVVEKRYLQ